MSKGARIGLLVYLFLVQSMHLSLSMFQRFTGCPEKNPRFWITKICFCRARSHLITNAAERIQQQANAEISKQMMYNLCGKLNDESHMRSKIHLRKVAEQAHLDIALGRLIPFALR